MPGIIETVEFLEHVGESGLGQSPADTFWYDVPDAGGSKQTRVYDVAWSDRFTAVQELLGYSDINGNGGSNFVSRAIPDGDPDFVIAPTRLNLNKRLGAIPYRWASRVQAQGFGIDPDQPSGESRMKSLQQTVVYGRARLTIEYTTRTYNVLSDAQMIQGGYTDSNGNPDESSLVRYVTVVSKPKGQYLGLGGPGAGNMIYATGPLTGKPLQASPGVILPTWDLQVTWHQVPLHGVPSVYVNPNLQASSTLGAADITAGKVNSVTFAGYPAGTLLALPPEFTPRSDPFGYRIYDVVYFFEFVPTFHNYVPMIGGTPPLLRFEEISTDGTSYGPVNDRPPLDSTGKHIYDTADFRLLFRSP